jgi:hypothetical protein
MLMVASLFVRRDSISNLECESIMKDANLGDPGSNRQSVHHDTFCRAQRMEGEGRVGLLAAVSSLQTLTAPTRAVDQSAMVNFHVHFLSIRVKCWH